VALPPLTPEQRAQALEKAATARRERAAVKNRLKYAQGSLAEVIADGKSNDVVGKMKRPSSLPRAYARLAVAFAAARHADLAVPEPRGLDTAHGAFYQASLSLELDGTTLALALTSPITHSRIRMLNDPDTNGRNSFLAAGPEGSSGLMMVEYVAAGAIASRGSGVESPFKRMAASFGPRLSLEWLAETAARLEARDGYGTIASFVIRQFPLVGTGVGTFHDLVPMYARMLFHGPLQPDNAQNWFRHQLVEFGLLGSLGWIAWVGVLLWALAFGRTASRALTAGVLRGVLVGFGLISLVGMPGQDVTVVITFWVLAFWYLLLLDSKTTTTLARRIPAAAWVVVWAIALGHAAATAYVARGGMRPPIRIAAADLDYSYGFYAPEPGGTARWAAKQAVETVPVPPNRRRMEITVWVNHLDVASSPVDARVWVDRQLVVDTRLSSIEPVTRTVEIAGARPRAVVETWVSRTLNPRDFGVPDDRQLGLLVDWKFLDSPPPDTVP